VNDIIIMNGDTSVSPGTVGEVWLRGPNVMKGYWRDQGSLFDFIGYWPLMQILSEATDKVIRSVKTSSEAPTLLIDCVHRL